MLAPHNPNQNQRRPRRNHGVELKAWAALAAIRGDKALAEIAEQFKVHAHQITEWKKQLLERAADVFDGGRSLGAGRGTYR